MEKEKKKGNKARIVWVTILIVLLLGAFFGFGYALGANKILNIFDDIAKKEVKVDNTSTESKDDTNQSDSGELDINSRLVQFLYNEVSEDFQGQYFNYFYSNNYNSKDYYVDQQSEESKMWLVGRLITSNVDVYSGPVNGTLCEETRKIVSKARVEALYHQLYGSSAKLDTSAVVHIGHLQELKYSESFDGYYLCSHEGGGTYGGSETAKLVKAIEEGNSIKLYQDVEIYDAGVLSEQYQLIYTFEKESDGLYKFISKTQKKD